MASRYKVSIPISAYSVKNRKVFLTDKGPEFRGDYEKLIKDYNVKIQKARS
ncbi:10615_t:CDS:2, partial [Funneliformis geosporum]